MSDSVAVNLYLYPSGATVGDMSEGKLTPLLLLLLLGSQLVTAQLQDRIQRFLREPPDQTAKVSAKRSNVR